MMILISSDKCLYEWHTEEKTDTHKGDSDVKRGRGWSDKLQAKKHRLLAAMIS